ncbi:MAG: aldehyde dehydrogenase family protein [Mycobacteriaceae bacterium]|nr:aldehyde dehydrogenase family protein [Mycobacteriaceae bacterium]
MNHPTTASAGASALAANTIHDVADIAARLRAAQPQWQDLGVVERVGWLNRLRDWLDSNETRVTDVLRQDVDATPASAARDRRMAVAAIEAVTANAAEYLGGRHPRPNGAGGAFGLDVGARRCRLVGVLAPWTSPLCLSLQAAAAALLAGAAVLAKPSVRSPAAARVLAEGWGAVGAPAVFAAVYGRNLGPAVVDAVDYVRFTGAADTGRAVAHRAAERLIPCRLEVGGKAPAVVLADADLGHAAAGIARGGLTDNGRLCAAIERVYVEDPIYDAFVEALVAEVDTGWRHCEDAEGACAVGDPDARVASLLDHVNDAVARGAAVRIGGRGADGVFEPTVLTGVDQSMAVMTEQTYGPILPVMRVRDADHAVLLANDGYFGRAASIWAGDRARAARIAADLTAGSVDINEPDVHLR